MNITFILWLEKNKMKNKSLYGGMGGGSAGASASLQWQIAMLAYSPSGSGHLPVNHQVVLWVCAAATSPQVRKNALCVIFPREGSSGE